MKKNLLMLLFCTNFFLMQVFAQDRVVSGTVTSAEDGMPIPGVTVKIKSATTGTQTDLNGKYSLKAKTGDILVFTFLGMLAQEKTVSNAGAINIALKQDNKALKEVVVTAFGIERDKDALGYSAQTIKGEEVANTQRENFLNSLQGRVAGATITPTNGVPGSSSQIIIRGAVSLDGDNQPLFVVDGLPISNRTFSEYDLVGQGTYNRTNDYGNRAMDINPEEIETITILKGPEASALYGTDGASGAVVITTKKAKAGAARVSYSNNFRVETAYRFPPVQNTYGPGAGGIFDEENQSRVFFGAKYPANQPQFDNIGNFYQSGFTQRHNASVEGGTDKLSLRTTLSYTDQTGIIPGTGYNNVNLKLSGVSQISKKLSLNASLNLINSKTDKTYKGSGSPMISSLTWPLNDDMRNYLTEAGTRRTITGALNGELDNPYWGVRYNPNNDKNKRVLANVGLDYKALEWLSFSIRGGADVSAGQGLSAYHPEAYNANTSGSSYAGGGINTYNSNELVYSGTFITTIKKDFGKFKPLLRLGTDIRESSYQVNSQYGSKFYQQDFYSLNNTDPTTQRVAYKDELKRKQGFFASAEFGYDNFLYLTLTGRQELSSTLPIDDYAFFYPAVSLSFVFSELAPFKELDWLSYGKLRGSWGQSGKDARTAYITKTKLIAQTTTGGGFATDVTAGNSGINAEFTTSKEIGLDLSFFNRRLSFDFSYFQTLSDKQITAPRLSYGTGAILGWINSGEIKYKGFELLVKGTPIKNKNFAWDISANISRQKGKILSLPADQEVFYLSDTWLFDNVRAQYTVGSSVSAFAGIQYLKNDNGDLLINPLNGMPIKDANFTPMGDRAPDFMMGVTNSFTYKNFNLSFLFDIRKGGDIYNATELYLYARGASKLTLDRETPRIIAGVMRDGLENTANPTINNVLVNPYITTSYYSTYYNTLDFLEKDINWIRMKDITLAYNLPKTLFAKSKVIKSGSVFATGTDLLLISNYKGVDPAVNGLSAASGGLGGSGIDFGSVGLPRGYNFGVKIGF